MVGWTCGVSERMGILGVKPNRGVNWVTVNGFIPPLTSISKFSKDTRDGRCIYQGQTQLFQDWKKKTSGCTAHHSCRALVTCRRKKVPRWCMFPLILLPNSAMLDLFLGTCLAARHYLRI